MTQQIKEPTLIRWLAIACAVGATSATALTHFRSEIIWPAVGIIMGFLVIACVTLLWNNVKQRSDKLAAAAEKNQVQDRAVDALQEELAMQKQLERELSEAKHAAEAAMMAKGEFLATMSHEIRTPLNGIIPMLDLLLSSNQKPDQHDITRTAYASAKQMLRIVDDILDYSKLEANKLQLESTSFNLREILESVIHLMEKTAESKGLRLGLSIDPNVRLPVRGDPVRLRQVLTNLLSNAIKFTERGSVNLSVSKTGDSRTQHELRFEVRDTGIGISKQAVVQLFKPFHQADASTTRLYGGTGLGLAICKRIIDLMGGSINVESEPGRGSIFYFDIPLQKAAGDMQNLRLELNGSKVLALTTDAMIRQKLQQSAAAWGVTTTFADSTQDALNRLKVAHLRGNTWAYNLLLVDLNSVRSTAVALHRSLTRAEDLGDLHVVYLQGAETPPAEMQGGNLFLPRLIGMNELRSALQSYISQPDNKEFPAPTPSLARITSATPQPTQSSAVIAAATPLKSEPKTPIATTPAAAITSSNRLLLVEDNPVNLLVAQRLVSLIGAQCDCAEHGEKALEMLRAHQYAAVLMDCQMPVKDGYTATGEWREHERINNLPRLPIIAMTANAMAGDRQKCLDAGMDDYLSKPVDRRLLEEKIRQWAPKSLEENAASDTGASENNSKLLESAQNVVNLEAEIAPIKIQNSAQSIPATNKPAASVVTPLRSVATSTPAPASAPAAKNIPTAVSSTPPTAPVASSQTAVTTPTNNPTPAPVPVLDSAVLEELKAVMGSEYISLIRLFLEDAPKHIQALEKAASDNDIPGMVTPAHTLKSSSANLGAMSLSAAAKRIEQGARQGVVPRPAILVAVLEQEFRRAQIAMQKLI